jgi:hypothetical protein
MQLLLRSAIFFWGKKILALLGAGRNATKILSVSLPVSVE